MEQPAPASSLLPYADLPARYGIQYEVRPGGVSIVMPSPPWWRRAEIVAPLALIPLVAGQQMLGSAVRNDVSGMVMGGAMAAAFLVGALLASRFRKPVVLELTPDTLRLENVRPLFWSDNRVVHTLRYPRADVYDVRFVEHSGNLVIRVQRCEMVELRPAEDERLVRWIAEELRQALGLPA